MVWFLYLTGLLAIELAGIIWAVIGLRRDNGRLFLFGFFTMHFPAYVTLVYIP